MILELYLLLAGLAILFSALAWYDGYSYFVFGWIAPVLMFSLAITSLDIMLVTYEGGWQTSLIQEYGYMYLWYGLGFIHLGYAFVNSFLVVTGKKVGTKNADAQGFGG